MEETEVTVSDGKKPVEIELNIECGVQEDSADSMATKRPKSRFRDTTLVLTMTSDLEFIDFRRISCVIYIFLAVFADSRPSTKALKSPKSFVVTAHLTKPSQSVIVQMTSVCAQTSFNAAYNPWFIS